MDFYDEIAQRYDQITQASRRAGGARAFCEQLLRRHPAASVLDVACGTGMYAMELARRGVRATGADISQAMLDVAAKAAAAESLDVRWVCCPMQELGTRVEGTFDAIICMGNSIPHLLEDRDLSVTLAGFAHMLAPGGVAVLQLLNYAKVLQRQERIVGIDRDAASEREYVRFYDFLDGRLRFNILEIAWPSDEPQHTLHSTTLRPYTADELAAAIQRHPLGNVERFGSLNFGPFDAATPETVMIVARKQ